MQGPGLVIRGSRSSLSNSRGRRGTGRRRRRDPSCRVWCKRGSNLSEREGGSGGARPRLASLSSLCRRKWLQWRRDRGGAWLNRGDGRRLLASRERERGRERALENSSPLRPAAQNKQHTCCTCATPQPARSPFCFQYPYHGDDRRIEPRHGATRAKLSRATAAPRSLSRARTRHGRVRLCAAHGRGARATHGAAGCRHLRAAGACTLLCGDQTMDAARDARCAWRQHAHSPAPSKKHPPLDTQHNSSPPRTATTRPSRSCNISTAGQGAASRPPRPPRPHPLPTHGWTRARARPTATWPDGWTTLASRARPRRCGRWSTGHGVCRRQEQQTATAAPSGQRWPRCSRWPGVRSSRRSWRRQQQGRRIRHTTLPLSQMTGRATTSWRWA